MIVYVNNNDEVLWLHDDNTLKDTDRFRDDDNCILVEGKVGYADIPDEDNIYVQKFNRETQEVYVECLGAKPKEEPIEVPITLKDIKEDTTSTKEVTSLTSEDTLTTLEYLVTIEEKMDRILSILENRR